MKVLVTGGTGFLGSRLAKRLAGQGHRVRALSRRGAGKGPLGTPSLEIVPGDLRDPDSLRRAIDGVDAVCHAAAAMHGPWSTHLATTVQGTERLLDLARRSGVKRFVHISSITVYRTWDCERGSCLDETAPCDPEPAALGPYIRAKIEAERHAFRALQQGLPVVVIRPGIIYGPGGRVLHPRVGYGVSKRLFLQVGDGTLLLPLTYLDNTIDGIGLALVQDRAVGEIYNLVDGEAITQKAFLECYRTSIRGPSAVLPLPLPLLLAGAALVRSLKRIGLPSIETTRRGFKAQYADVRFDAAKARRELGWQPRITLEEGLRKTFSSARLPRDPA